MIIREWKITGKTRAIQIPEAWEVVADDYHEFCNIKATLAKIGIKCSFFEMNEESNGKWRGYRVKFKLDP